MPDDKPNEAIADDLSDNIAADDAATESMVDSMYQGLEEPESIQDDPLFTELVRLDDNLINDVRLGAISDASPEPKADDYDADESFEEEETML